MPFCDQAYVVDESDVKVRFENVSTKPQSMVRRGGARIRSGLGAEPLRVLRKRETHH